MGQDLKELLNLAEDCINSGRISEGGGHLAKVPVSKIPRSEIIRASRLFRRAGATDQSLRLLLPIVRPKAPLLQPASAHEKAEFAVCLQRAGSLEEAREVLNQVTPEESPITLLYKAVFMYSEWNYRGGIPYLEQLLKLCKPEENLYRMTQLNLAAGLVVEEQYAQAETILAELRTTTKQNGEHLLYCNSLEVSAQVAIFTGDPMRGQSYLNEAENVLKGTQTLDWLWIIKWRAIAEAVLKRSTQPLEHVRQEALAKKHWETVREVDFISCKIAFDQNVYLRLYFGTNFPEYRRRLVRHFGEPSFTHAALCDAGAYRPADGTGLNLFRDLNGELSPGDLPHILLTLLLSDCYRSLSAGQVHSRLFPGDHFNPYTSRDRVYQVVKRVRAALETQIPGLAVTSDDNMYKIDLINFTGAIEIPKNLPAFHPLDMKLYSLREHTKKDHFSSDDVQKTFSLSRAAANRLISQWRENGRVETEDKTRPPIYSIKKPA